MITKYFTIPKLVTDKALTESQIEIFKTFLIAEDLTNDDWRLRKLVSFCLYKALNIFILISLLGEKPKIKKNLDFVNLKTIIGSKFFHEWFFSQLKENWLHEKWYRNKKYPIIANINGVDWVIDGNHRLAQQIIHNKIKFYYILVEGSWFTIFLNVIFGKYKK